MRRANKNSPLRLAIALVFLPHEVRAMQRNEPGPSGLLGGFPTLENRLLDLIEPGSGLCVLGPEDFTRLMVYMLRDYGPGGPNGRVRGSCIPALRRAGIDVAPEWRAPAATTEGGADHHVNI